jgi:macrolide transport system ATP-binding/permease protein
MKDLLRRLNFFLRRKQLERELDEEMRHHLSLATEERGSVPFGNIALLKEESRAMWTFTFWEQLAQDVRYGLRAMAGNKLFTSMAVLSLALGIGANTAIYSFMDAVLLRTLPVRHPEELVIAQWHAAGRSSVVKGVNGTMHEDGTGMSSPNFPFAAWESMRQDRTSLSTLFAYAGAYQLNLIARNQAEVANGVFVSGEYFGGLGVAPAIGRAISDDDDRSGAPAVAVIGYTYWQRRFALDPAALGSQVQINGVPFTIVGISPAGFFGVDAGSDPAVFMPLHAEPSLSPRPADDEKRRFFTRAFYWLEMMGRLKPGVSMQQAKARMAGQFGQYLESTVTTAKDRVNMPSLFLEEGASGIDSLRRQYSKPLLVLMTMVGLILAIACANIANLLLARATSRRREMAVRLSLGAGRMRVVRQLLTESLLLSLSGGALGLGVAFAGIRALTWLLGDGRGELIVRAGLNWQVLAFTMALAIFTGVIFGLIPALQATKVDVTPALKETRSSAAQARTRRFGIRAGLSHALVISQIAISLLLVIAAGLFVHTLTNLRAVELGFNRENVLLFKVNARPAGYKEAALAGFYAGLLERFRVLPGVSSAAASQNALVSQHWNGLQLSIGGVPAPEKPLSTCVMSVDRAFLSTMQIPILAGRGMEARDMQSPRIAVVSERFAKQFFPGQNPLGKVIGFGGSKEPVDITIVGIARDSRYNNLKSENPPVAYVPFTQDLKSLGGMTFELRATGNPLALSNSVRRIVHEASAAAPVSEITTQSGVIDETIKQERAFADLCTCFAGLALIIACVGLYGTMAYAVARRTGEIGIRMALGAQRGRVVWMVVREVLVLAAVGLTIGLFTAWETAHFVASFLWGMKPNDPVSMGASVALLVAAALVAGYAPAWRASRIDPMVALRHE